VTLKNTLTSGLVLAASLVLVSLSAAPVSAQLTGVVVDEEGDPLQGVSIEAWNDGGKIAVRLTDDAGGFEFPDSIRVQTTVLWAARLGFRPLNVGVEQGIAHYELTLEEEAVSVQGLVVEAPREMCGGREDADARFLWERVRARYHPALDTLGVATYMAWAEDVVSIDDIGEMDLPVMAIEQRGSAPQLRFSWRRRVEDDGYAFRTRRVESGRSFDSWVYAPIHADFAPHLIDAVFGKLHDFRFVEEVESEFSTGDEGWVVAFCPKEDEPRIRGTFTISSDTTLVGAEWSFETDEPVENAGGQAVFFPVTGEPGDTYLLPAQALFWRQVTLDRYYQRYQRYEGWQIARGDSVPTLPTRRPPQVDASPQVVRPLR
jgi:hypothetical protein